MTETRDPRSLIGLVPARGSSKGIHKKNLREVGEVSLLARAIRRARRCESISRVVVSTDDPDLAAMALEEGAVVPGLRPAELAADTTPMLDVVRHVWSTCGPEAAGLGGVVLLQPTSPFIRPATVERGIEIFRSCDASVLKAVRRVREHPDWMLRPGGQGLVPLEPVASGRRQDLSELYLPCGGLYIYDDAYLTSPDPAAEVAWIELAWPESLDVDEEEDLWVAQCLAAFGLEEELALETAPAARLLTLSP